MAAEPTLRRSSLERQQIKNLRDLVQKAKLPASIWRNWRAPLNPLVMDNLSSHHRKALVDRFGAKFGGLLWERVSRCITPPEDGSWPNQAGSRSACSPVGAWADGESRRSDNYIAKQRMEPENELRPCHHQLQFTSKEARQKFGYKRNEITRSET